MGRYLDEIINEKVTYGRDVTIRDNGYNYGGNSSLNTRDASTSHDEKYLEDFDKQKIKMILESQNIVEEYKLYVNLEVDKIKDKKENISGLESNIITMFDFLKTQNIDEEKIKKLIINNFYDVSDDPKVVKKLLQLRINYNNKIVSMLQKMLRTNYQILGISSEEADKLSHNLSKDKTTAISIIKIKQIFLKNKDKFMNKGFIDLRELGFGVCYETTENRGEIESKDTIDKIIQLLMRYDCVIIAHGGDIDDNSKNKLIDNKDKYDKNQEKISEIEKTISDKRLKLSKEEEKIEDTDIMPWDMDKLYNSKNDDEYIKILKLSGNKDNNKIAFVKNVINTIYELETEINELKSNEYELMRKKKSLDNEYDELYISSKRRWSCQKIKTETGGPFSDVNDLVRQCIKEGKKNIYIMICNPGHYKLDKDILQTKGVHIRMSNNDLYVE